MQKIKCFKYLVYGLAFLLLQACEAPLKLDSVVSEKAKALHRTDRLQATSTNGKVIAVVGSFGVVLVSSDAGKNWTRQQLKGQPTLIDISACPDNSLVTLSVEGDVWVSDDNGKSWQSHKIETAETPQAITCAPDSKLWVVGSFSTFLSSADKGVSWSSQSLDEDMILSYITFFDADHGVATGEFGNLLSTTDGGKNWQMVTTMPNEFYPISALFTDMNTGWVAGLGGKILYTENAGQSWSVEETGTPVPLYGLSKNGQRLFAVGALGTVLTRTLTDSDSSIHWEPFFYQNKTRSYLRASMFNKDFAILAGGSGVLFRSSLAEGEK